MVDIKRQKGFIPLPIVLALAVSMLLGGFLGYQLGDGTFFSFGLGVGAVLVIGFFALPYMERIKKYINGNIQKNVKKHADENSKEHEKGRD